MTQHTTRPLEIARVAYTAFRGSFREAGAPPRWDDLTDREKHAFACVAQWAIDDENMRAKSNVGELEETKP